MLDWFSGLTSGASICGIVTRASIPHFGKSQEIGLSDNRLSAR
jgi:hypothetical protein